MSQIIFFCKRCSKSMKVRYNVSGDDNAPVLPNVELVCHHCKRIMYFRNYTEGKLVENSVGGKYYM